jgi:hypothetical protein
MGSAAAGAGKEYSRTRRSTPCKNRRIKIKRYYRHLSNRKEKQNEGKLKGRTKRKRRNKASYIQCQQVAISNQQRANKALHPTAYSPTLVPRFGLPAAGELVVSLVRAASPVPSVRI